MTVWSLSTAVISQLAIFRSSILTFLVGEKTAGLGVGGGHCVQNGAVHLILV